QPFIAMLDKGNVRLNQARLHFVVTKTGPRIERADVIKSSWNCLNRSVDGPRNFLMLLVLQRSQMLVNDRNSILSDLCWAVSILAKLRLVIAQLIMQAFTKIAASHAGRVELANDLNCFLKLIVIEADLESWPASIGRGRRWRRLDCSGRWSRGGAVCAWQ